MAFNEIASGFSISPQLTEADVHAAASKLLLPSFPFWMLDGSKATRRAWFLKDRMLPPIYWHGMLKGREWLAKPTPLARLK